MGDSRYDVIYGKGTPTIDHHFCRDWDFDDDGKMRGCYGTNQNHGMSLDDACEEIAKWHEMQARSWREGTHVDTPND